jgi:mono/diheme cytochrome c family protein
MAFAALLLGALGGAAAQTSEPAASAASAPAAEGTADHAAMVDAGRKLYTSYCARCHGINLAMAGQSFDLRTFPPTGKDRFVRSVMKGTRAMPAWESVLKPADVDALWAYLGSVNGWTATGKGS